MLHQSNKKIVLYVTLTGKILRFPSPSSDSRGLWGISYVSQIIASVLPPYAIFSTFSVIPDSQDDSPDVKIDMNPLARYVHTDIVFLKSLTLA